ncbi:MAG: hypothetical protein E6G85_11940 [Alphaproteobacteria bacterium]|nr:MAG: hypothetical protein E6G85_11940 [Alphaproteobacteria bacterium]
MSIRSIALALLIVTATATPVRADSGIVQAVVTKGGFIVGVGGGRGTLIFHDRSYPLVFGGMGLGATIGLSTAKLGGHAYHLKKPADIEGTYTAIGSGAALAIGQGGVRLRNAKGVVLQLAGARVGVELSIAFSGVTVRLR